MVSDEDLLRAWRAGDETAGARLFRRHFSAVFRFFQTKAPEAVEDLVQRTFLACLEAGERLDVVISFQAYLLGIARKQLLRFFAEQGRWRRHAELEGPSAFDLTGPVDLLAQADEERLLLKGLRRLPLDLQIALELFYWERLPLAEIATIVDIPLGTVKTRLHRAKRMLRQRIEALDATEALKQSTVHKLESWARALRDQLVARDDSPSPAPLQSTSQS